MKVQDILKEAHEKDPTNVTLFMGFIQSLHDNDQYEEAYNVLKRKEFNFLTSDIYRLVASEVCLKNKDFESALKFSDSETPEAKLMQAKIHLETGNPEKSNLLYKEAIASQASLEDRGLTMRIAAALSSSRHQHEGNNVIKLASINGGGEYKIEPWQELRSSKTTFENVGGLIRVKTEIHRKIVLPFSKPSLFQKFRKKIGGGVLLYGPPGCGKTLLARATAGECNAQFYNVEIADILDMYIGESERKMRDLFDKARHHIPSVIFFDEMEALASRRQHHSTPNSSQLVSQFLSELDGFSQNNSGILVLGATNAPWNIDPAFRRPGRFDRIIFVPPPDYEARLSILKILLASRPVEENIDFFQIAQKTSGFSGADLENLVETACVLAIEESLKINQDLNLSRNHLEQALKVTKSSTLEWLTTARNYAKYANEGGQYDDVISFLKEYGKS